MPASATSLHAAAMNHDSDFKKLVDAHDRLKLFLARCVGFVAIGYGALTLNAYFFILGIGAVGLFWMWDRMYATAAVDPQEQTPAVNSTDDSN